jgi:poly(hydroxyalkanoate) depolymerase family esterase
MAVIPANILCNGQAHMRNFGQSDHWERMTSLDRFVSTGTAERKLDEFAFVPNPGNLVAKKFVLPGLRPGAPLVVVLHGCTQTPEGYDRGTGWTHLAERHGFAVLYPEQSRANNANGCFNWFEPGDMRRSAGEPASIKAMIDQMVAHHALDPSRVYITGLSAGAAMAGVMIATYPEVFAGGGLIAGLPYGTARSMPAAFSRMQSRGRETGTQLGDLVRNASSHTGPWPTVSIWHGTADMTVNASNADATVAQWREVHDLADVQSVEDVLDGHPHRVWRDASGRICVEEYAITGMGHGTPLDAGNIDNAEIAGAYLLDVGLSSTQCLATSWGLIEAQAVAAPRTVAPVTRRPTPTPKPMPTSPDKPTFASARERVRPDVQKIIEDALRSAGLMQ